MIVDDPKVIKYISPNDGSKGQLEPNDNEVQHQTFGSEGGDLSVGLYGVGFTWYITLDGRIFQLWDTDSVTWHCNGANRRAKGREYESPAGGPLTPEQIGAGGYLTALEIRLGLLADSYVDPATHAPASIHVNSDLSFHGAISHQTVMTDDGTSQHTDHITVDEWNRMRHAPDPQPAPTDPYVMPYGRPIMGPRTILVNGGVDTFEIDSAGVLWWHHVDAAGTGHPSIKVPMDPSNTTGATNGFPLCDPSTDIEITATPFGPFLTCSRKETQPGEAPTYWQIRIIGLPGGGAVYVARLL